MQQPFHFHFFLFLLIIINHPLFPSSGAQPLEFANISILFSSSGAQPLEFANAPAKWINNKSGQGRYINYYDNGFIRIILFKDTYDSDFDPNFGCGFICPLESVSAGSCESFLFSIFIGSNFRNQHIVWSANRDRPVRENATLEFSKDGDLVLRDFDGTTVWSTNTSGKSVVRMELNEAASLVLFDDKNKTVWSSMDYPTDSLVLGQTLRQGQRLTANVSRTNSSQGPFYLNVVRNGFQVCVGSQLYYQYTSTDYVSYSNGGLYIIDANSFRFMQLDDTGHLRVYGWDLQKDSKWSLLWNSLPDDVCGSPTACGEYGICSNSSRQCSCPTSDDGMNYFRPVDHKNPKFGCVPINALSCKSAKTQQLLSLISVDFYFSYTYHAAVYIENTNAEACKRACLANCSCKAALFQYYYTDKASSGNCYLPSELYSLTYYTPGSMTYNKSAFIKVQTSPTPTLSSGTNPNKLVKSKKGSVGAIVGVVVASLLVFILILACVSVIALRRRRYREGEHDDEFDMLPGQLTRFAFEGLRVATNNFSRKLGEGGFGSVFEGTLVDGTKIAIKRLDGVGQGMKEFLAEVETIGSIHHLHLVRLVGFCAEKSYRLLIYEYMLNGSLDKWIFYKDHDTVLDWQTRRKIITDIAKGLTYLHEECRQKIVHLDIKPQNILLDENFNAKVSDFGLAKLIDRDQIEVMTRMRGTPGYLAPEWLTSIITEKVDVFSFGVVVLEIVCGRRNLDNSKDDESFHLIGLLERKVAENKLVDMLDYRCTDMKVYIEDVIMIIYLAMWCIQSDSNRRPLMSVVLKVLDGSVKVETDLDYNFSNPTRYLPRNVNILVSSLPTPSILSGPR